jgi:hypothetical protein
MNSSSSTMKTAKKKEEHHSLVATPNNVTEDMLSEDFDQFEAVISTTIKSKHSSKNVHVGKVKISSEIQTEMKGYVLDEDQASQWSQTESTSIVSVSPPIVKNHVKMSSQLSSDISNDILEDDLDEDDAQSFMNQSDTMVRSPMDITGTGPMEIFGRTQISSWEIGQMDESPSSRFGSNVFSMETSSKLYLQPFSPFSPENIGVVPVIRDNTFQHIDPVVESLKRKKNANKDSPSNLDNPFKVKNLEDNMEGLQIDEISPQPDEWNHDDDLDPFSENVNVPNSSKTLLFPPPKPISPSPSRRSTTPLHIFLKNHSNLKNFGFKLQTNQNDKIQRVTGSFGSRRRLRKKKRIMYTNLIEPIESEIIDADLVVNHWISVITVTNTLELRIGALESFLKSSTRTSIKKTIQKTSPLTWKQLPFDEITKFMFRTHRYYRNGKTHHLDHNLYPGLKKLWN